MNPGKLFIIIGVVFILTGLIILGVLGPLGKLPGDIVISRGKFTFYFPVVTSILLSIILTLFFLIFRKFF